MSPVAIAAYAVEGLLILAGLAILWRDARRPAEADERRLPRWRADAAQTLGFFLAIFAGLFVGSLSTSGAVRLLGLRGDLATIVAGAGAQLGMLAGVLLFAARTPGFVTLTHGAAASVRQGGAIFLASLPLLFGTQLLWEFGLRSAGIEPRQQDLIRLFAEADSPATLVTLVALAVAIAPLAEELVFRAGLFRLARGYLPRVVALALPAVFFAALHVDWASTDGLASFGPLIAFAIILSLAYERTGNIAATILAHALFNLNTVILIFCGVAT